MYLDMMAAPTGIMSDYKYVRERPHKFHETQTRHGMHAVMRSSRSKTNAILRRLVRALKLGEGVANGHMQGLRAIVTRAWHELLANAYARAMGWEMEEKGSFLSRVPRNSGTNNAPPYPVPPQPTDAVSVRALLKVE